MSNPYGSGPQPNYNQQPGYPQQHGYQQPGQPQPGQGYQQPNQQPGTFTCPKCRGMMRTYQRNNVQIEQCDSCRGVFLDFGELESIVQLEGTMGGYAAPPQQHASNYGPGWGKHGNHHYRNSGFSRLFFST